MAWSTPKINWNGSVVNDVYVGDRFNATDFNRIKNNISYLRDLAVKLYNDFEIHSLGNDRTPKDYFYADEINKIEENLSTINNNTIKRSYATARFYMDNGIVMNFRELNRIENTTLDLYEKLTNEYNGRRTLTWNFGMKGDL